MTNIKIYVLYGSQTGNAEEISKNIYALLNNKGFLTIYSSLNNVIKNNTFDFLPKDEDENENENTFLIIVCSTTGNGDVPDTANNFWLKLKNRNLEKNIFNKVKYSILALGDSNYDNFCKVGKNIDKKLAELGGDRFLELHCVDDGIGEHEIVELFIGKIIKYFK
jgi:sulfite reductase alpha subunit-like flavoprotein